MSESLHSYVEKAVEFGEKLGLDVVIVRGLEKIHNQIRFSQNNIDINKQWHTNVLEVFLVVDKNFVATGEFSPSNEAYIKNQIKSLAEFARKMSPSPFFQGVEENTVPSYPVIIGGYDSTIDQYREKAPEHIIACINAACEAGATRVAGSYLFGETYSILKSSLGPYGQDETTFFNLTVRAFQDELDASGQGLSCGRIPSMAEKELLMAATRAGTFSKLHKNAVQAKPGIYDIVMTPTVAANLLGIIPDMANPVAIMMGLSALGDKMGEKLAPEFVNVDDNGLFKDGLASEQFDIEGTPHQNTPIIKDGVLVNLIHNTSTSKIMGGQTTGNSNLLDIGIGSKFLAPTPTNRIFNNGDHSLEELLQSENPTVFVSCNWYTRYTSRISTDYSTIPRDASFLVENGELGVPIKNFRISDNLLRQFANIDAMGKDRVQVKWWEVEVPTFIPTIRVKNCRITTATQ